MKLLLILYSFLILLNAKCNEQKSPAEDVKQDTAQAAAVDTSSKETAAPINTKVKGKVSHRYAAKGCSTVLVLENEIGEELILIPVTALKSEFDKEGQIIYFNYRPLKRVQPAGCEKGMPVEVTDVSLQ
jgi:hypothetical protein